MKKAKRGRPPKPAGEKAQIISLTLYPEQQAVCLRLAGTVQDGIRELIRRADAGVRRSR
jgi:hypothetical protein